MAHMVIEDVRKGIDTRRYSLASPDGTLTEGVDGHITSGGNFEKRKAFYPITLPAGSFGLQPIGAGLQVFGSGADPGGWPNDADGQAITYQRLQHPAILAGEADVGNHDMTAVVFSDVYGGYAFVIAQFEDGKRYCYYNGSLVRDFTDGLILAGRTTLAEIVADFDAIVDRTGVYTSTNNGVDIVTVTGPAGVKWQAAAEEVTAGNGTVTELKTSDPVSAVPGNAATASFKIMAGSSTPGTTFATTNRARTSNVATITIGTHTLLVGTKVNVTGVGGSGYNASDLVLTAVTGTTISYANVAGDEVSTGDVGGTVTIQNQIVKVTVNSVEITNASVVWTNSNAATAALVAASINAKASSPEYTATAVDNRVTITAAESQGDTPNHFTVSISAAGNLCIGDGVFQAVGTQFTVDSLKVNGANILTALTPAYPGTNTTLSAQVTAIVNNINANTETHGYVACGVGPVLYLSKAVTTSDDVPLDVAFILSNVPTTGSNGFVQVGGGGENPNVPAMEIFLQVVSGPTYGIFQGQLRRCTYSLNCQVSGGVPGYHYAWVCNSSNLVGGGPLDAGDVSNVTLLLNFDGIRGGQSVDVHCVVTDAAGNIKASPVLTLNY